MAMQMPKVLVTPRRIGWSFFTWMEVGKGTGLGLSWPSGLPGGPAGPIAGRYFNSIVADLRRKRPHPTTTRILEWITHIHGHLSSPTGGGVRHRTHLAEGVELDLHQARLICNPVRS